MKISMSVKMVEDYIYDIRRNAIKDIIEKVNKNP